MLLSLIPCSGRNYEAPSCFSSHRTLRSATGNSISLTLPSQIDSSDPESVLSLSPLHSTTGSRKKLDLFSSRFQCFYFVFKHSSTYYELLKAGVTDYT
jgi:hypothetical protein